MLSPGVPLTHPKPHWTVERAKAAGVEVIGDIELFARERAARAPDAPLVAITGTNGKSTTTALIAHILREAGRDVALGGNIGVPVLDLPPPAPERVHVIECSSFQIDLAPSLKPSVGLLINLTPDHLDRHGTMENYAAIKERLVAASDTALVGLDDEYCRAIAARLKAAGRRVVGVSQARSETADVYRRRSSLVCERRRRAARSISASRPRLRGAHNGQNAAFAFAAARALGVEVDAIAQGLQSFPGLAHRMEQVARKGRVLFVNDSKATNADAAEKALLSFHDIFWILGGKAKEGGIEPLRYLFPRVRKAYLIGAATEDFAATPRRRRSPSSAAERSTRPSPPPRATPRRARRRSRSCCCRRPAPPTINSPISKRAAMRSARSSGNCDDAAFASNKPRTASRHARACPGHPRRERRVDVRRSEPCDGRDAEATCHAAHADVDGRDKPGHDGTRLRRARLRT